jgi:hypothetical protein
MTVHENVFLILSFNTITKEVNYTECKDVEDIAWKLKMYREDFGPEYIFLPYPDAMMMASKVFEELLALEDSEED